MILLSFVQFFFSRQLFCSQFFNFFACVWYNCFAHNYTLICLIYVERDLMIFLTIFLSAIFFLLWGYTIPINGNVFNVIEMCSTMFWIHCTTFGLFITTINMFLNVSVYGIYIFYLRFVHSQNLSHLINGFLLCCKCAFEC